MKTLVVTAADEAYSALLLDLLHSLRAAPNCRVACLDLGLSEATRTLIAPLVHQVLRPEWPFRAHPVFDARPTYLARAVRPFLSRYFPGYETYIWLDADCWLQDPNALATLTFAASAGSIAAVPAADRSYFHSTEHRDWVQRRYEMAFGKQDAHRLRPFPYVNSGVFALKENARHWVLWEARFQAALDRWEGEFLSDQALLNALIYLDGLPAELLPAEYNWICHLRPPIWSRARRKFINPNFPRTDIGLVHNTLNDKNAALTVPMLEGGTVTVPMTYRGYAALVAWTEANAHTAP